MKKTKQRFRVKPFKNPSGAVSWRVSGILSGKQVRKNFSSKEKAQDEADRLETAAMQADSRLTPRLTRLTATQLQAAELLFDRAGGDVDAVLAVLPLLRASERMAVKLAFDVWLSGLENAGRRDVTVQVNGYVGDAFQRVTSAQFIDQITRAEVETFVFEHSNSETQRDRRKRLAQFFKFCIARGWCIRNWAAEMPSVTVERDLPAILTPEQVKALLAASRAKFKPWKKSLELYVLLNTFTGLRPAESVKIGKAAFHTGKELACIELGAKVAKVAQCRQVEMIDDCRLMIAALVKRKTSWTGKDVYFGVKHWTRIRKEAGLIPEDGERKTADGVWRKDIMRHTYASWHYAVFKDIDRLAYTMGNSRQILFSNYIRPMTAADGKKYLEALK